MDKHLAPTGKDDDALALHYPPEYRAHKLNQDHDVDWICDKARSLRLNPLLNLTDAQRVALEGAVANLNIALGRNE